ncbi:MAG: FecR domain-containing protein, partial [Saprospiraceae bacterium]|nr:FecR domain-containing protein [Saprospiraceae bacterium]
MIENETYWTELIAKHLAGSTSDEEYRRLLEWLDEDAAHRGLYDQLEQVWNDGRARPIAAADKERYWQGIEQALDRPATPVKGLRVHLRRIAAVAAIVVLGVAIWQIVGSSDGFGQTLAWTATSEHEHLVLQDGSQVWLRQGSTLTYENLRDRRNVSLEGEAYFEVASNPDRPFSVRVGNAVARVLGTRFNLREMENGRVELFVTEGLVSFARADVPDGGINVAREEAAVTQIDRREPVRVPVLQHDVNRLSWQNQKLIFNHAPLTQVLRDLERHFHVAFVLANEGLGACEIKADFAAATLEEVLETIEFSLNSHIDFENGV